MRELSLIGLNYDELSQPGNVVPQKLFDISVERSVTPPGMFLVEAEMPLSKIVASLFVFGGGFLARVDYPRDLNVVPCHGLQIVDNRHLGVKSVSVRLDSSSFEEIYIPVAIQSGNPSIIYCLTSKPNQGLVSVIS